MIMVHDPLNAQTDPEGQAQGPATGEGERVAKALARAGVASRREVERLIEAGRVALNGKLLTTPAVKVEPGDILTVDGEVVDQAEPVRLFRYRKPAGLVTSHNDPQGRPTVFDALPKGLPRLISVGRLDLNTEGLLLLTNDGGLARALELPATALVRRYRARAHGRITQDKLDTLKTGVTVEGVRYGPIEATLDKAKEGPSGANLWITLTLAEGKNREVRRVLESLGLKVNRLLRLSYGPFALGNLDEGEVEEVGPRVIREQLADHIDPENLPQGDRPQWRPPKSATGGRRGVGAATSGPFGTQAPEAEAVRAKGKPAYKEGWAKPKPKVGRPEKPAKARPQDAKAAKLYYPAKPPRASKPGPATIGPSRDSGPVRDAAPRRDAGGTRDAAAKRAHTPARGSGPKRDFAPKREAGAPRDAAPKREFSPKRAPATPARDGAPRRDAAPVRDGAPKREFAPKRAGGPTRDAAPKRDVASKREFTPKRDAAPRGEGSPKREGGKPRPSGSPPAAGRPSGPRGRPGSPSRPGSPGARPPSPRPGGGPKPRG
jgi:23S rRNA pseudouridine2605 synthase